MKKILLLLLIFTFSLLKAQVTEDYIKKIDLKLAKDKNYLNLNYVSFNPADGMDSLLTSIPRALNRMPVTLNSGEEYIYRIVYLKEGVKIDSVQLLYLDEIKLNAVASDKLFGAVNEVTDDTTRLLTFRDIYFLKKNEPATYNALLNIVNENLIENEGTPPPNILGINPDEKFRTEMGFSSRDNKDYLLFENVNGRHWVPKKSDVRTGGRRRVQETGGFRIDASFSSISVSHSVMDFPAGSSGLELTAEDKIMNVLPWQSQTLSGGFRAIIGFGENKNDIYNTSYIDAKIMARFRLTSKDLYKNIPFISGEKPKLNFGNALAGELHFTRPFTLPFINVAFSTAKKAFDKPSFLIENETAKTAYFSFTQFEASMSFYWNTNADLENRFRLDLGAAFFDIWKADYSLDDELISKEMIQNRFQPLAELNYSFIPENVPLFGISLRYFDSAVKGKFWMKLIEFQNWGGFRFETYVISPVFFREQKDWETEGGAFFQIRYRYGL